MFSRIRRPLGLRWDGGTGDGWGSVGSSGSESDSCRPVVIGRDRTGYMTVEARPASATSTRDSPSAESGRVVTATA